MISEALQQKLSATGQSHVLRWWGELPDSERGSLLAQLQSIDFDHLTKLLRTAQPAEPADSGAADRVDRADLPDSLICQPLTDQHVEQWTAAARHGSRLLSAGRVAVITVAGGQGTRLGFEYPKGMFPVGPVTDRSLFRIFAEQILARRQRHSAEIPWLIMTSDATHSETVDYFRQHSFFGLAEDTIWFFRQGNFPALDRATGRILMESQSRLCMSPDGHGGLVAALQNAELLQRLQSRGVEHLFYHQVDNPTAIVCDPALLGFHALHGSELTTNVVRKVSPTERMGVLVDVGGRTEIIEYSEMTPEQAARTNHAGEWIFWAGNTAIHVFALAFLSSLAEDGGRLPLHVARKNVPHINDDGQFIQPDDPKNPNGFKFERFIFDALPLAARTLVVEGNRSREFNPVKNRDGADSPETARAALSRIARDWLRMAGVELHEHVAVEISALQALDADELRDRLQTGQLSLDDLVRSS